MKILLLVPQPFYQERGTPIATRMLVRALCGAGHSVDMLTYNLGDDVAIEGLQIFRTGSLPFIKSMPIGFSFGKLLYDVLLFFKTVSMLWKGSYDVLHAGEESIFFTLFIPRGKRAIVYDMDSSMPDQLLEKWSFLRVIAPVMYGFERLAIRRSDVVLPVCDALAVRVQDYAPELPLCVLEDVAMDLQPSGEPIDDINKLLPDNVVVAMYVGNLEHYQGIDLLIHSLAELDDCDALRVVFIGGSDEDIERYKDMAETAGVSALCIFLGSRPVADLMLYLEQADIQGSQYPNEDLLLYGSRQGYYCNRHPLAYAGSGRKLRGAGSRRTGSLCNWTGYIVYGCQPTRNIGACCSRTCRRPAHLQRLRE